jgi:hypothetical protein
MVLIVEGVVIFGFAGVRFESDQANNLRNS